MTSVQDELRPFTPSDYEAYVALFNAAHPERHLTTEEVRLLDEQREHHEILERRLLHRSGRLVGSVEYGTHQYNPLPGNTSVRIAVHPELEGSGVEDDLLSHAIRELRALHAHLITTRAREDHWELPFYQRHGFRELDRMWTSTLDVTRFDPARFAAFAQRSEEAGIQVKRLADLPYQEESFQQRWYALMIELLRDVPSAQEFSPWPFETWQRRVARSPKLLPGAYFLALDGPELVGVTELYPSTRPETIQTGLTGVRREWRRKGIAQTLKLHAAQYARDRGYRFVRTNNHSVNRPMLSINEAMGFVKEPAWVNLTRQV